MRIQHNIMALNAYRQLGGNNSALAKNLEKLSSGYAINRAGDDAAGLAISEKMRAQIKGLEAAQKNANDGISLVQTAEGALTEVHSMLNRMVYMATQSANGTYDDGVDRANLDAELQTLKDEIDRISKSTNFNGLKLLDGSMDADASQTTGGTTDVPILQEAATNPTLEVGTKTVLHKDNPAVAKTEINVELHDVNVTKKALAGDSLKFTVGDAEVELKIFDKNDPQLNTVAGALEAGQSYDSQAIAQKIADAFLAGDKLIGGQEFEVTVGTSGKGGKLTFTQKNEPEDPTEVVDANVDVALDYVSNPNGNPVEYTTKIKADALTSGNKITIGGDQLTLDDGVLQGKTTLADAFGGDGIETDSGYKVQYDANSGTLTVTDPNGTLGAPAVKYDDYATPLKVTSTITKGVDATKASGTVTFADMGLGADYAPKVGDQFDVGGETFTYGATGWTGGTTYEVTSTAGGLKVEAATPGAAGNTGTTAISNATIQYTAVGDDDTTVELSGGTAPVAASVTGTVAKTTIDAALAAAGGGAATGLATGITGITLDVDATGTTFTVQGAPAGTTGTATADADGNVTVTVTADTAGAAGNTTLATQGATNGADAVAATGTITLAVDPGNGDSIDIDGVTFTRDTNGNWTAGGANANNITVTGTGKELTVTIGGGTIDASVFNGAANALDVENVTYTAKTAQSDLTLAGGADATAATVVIDMSNVNMANGDKMIITGADGNSKEIIWDTDLATTLTNAGINATDLTGAGDLTGFNAAVSGSKITLTSTVGTGTASQIPSFKIETAKQQDKVAEVKTPANADSMTGTWNVRSTQNKQGAAANGGQLASTVFDLTADMVKDGNSLTIGKETYVFKVGADSTTKAAPGQTIIDLSNYKADDEGLIDAAGALLANQTANKAFTIGYSDDGKISIHEKEGQTQYTNGELESIEEFDKLVYMNSPEVTTATGKALTFQVGDTADDYQKVTLNIKDMSSAGLGIADISIGDIDSATDAIAKIKDAINLVSSQRGDLGAIQNRLEHTINNLGVQTENITAAESRIRDTDMAQEMMAYTKNNILVQAAQAMLAQANQVPQGILQLLQ